VDPAMADYYEQLMSDKWQLLLDSGVEAVTMSDNDEFLELAYDSVWDTIVGNSPDLGSQMKEMLIK
jgi:hypothetical protein